MSDEQRSIWDDLDDPRKAGFSESPSVSAKQPKAKRIKKVKPEKPTAPVATADANLSEADSFAFADKKATGSRARKSGPGITKLENKPDTWRSGVLKTLPLAFAVTLLVLGIGFGVGYVIALVFPLGGTNATESAEYQSTVNPDSGWLYVENVIEGIPGSAMTVLDRGFAEASVEDLNSVTDSIAAELATIIGMELSLDGKPEFPALLTNDDKEVIAVQATTAPRLAVIEHRDEVASQIIELMNGYASRDGVWSEPQTMEQDGGFFITSHRVDDPLEAWTIVMAPQPSDSGVATDIISVMATSSWHVLEGKESLFEEYVIQKAKAQHKAK